MPPKLSLAVFSGDFTKVHYALVMAAAAAAVNTQATLFFTMEACRFLTKAPGWQGLPGSEQDAGFISKGIAGFEELLQACVDLGVTFMVCDMGLRAVGLELSDLREDIPLTAGGIVTWLNDAAPEGRMLFI